MTLIKWDDAKLNELLSNEERIAIWEETLAQGETGALIRYSMRVEDLCFRRLRGLESGATQNMKPKVQSRPSQKGNVISLFEAV